MRALGTTGRSFHADKRKRKMKSKIRSRRKIRRRIAGWNSD
jgi:hypothetical protein